MSDRSGSQQAIRGLGVVAIGRNEGERLEVCLRSVLGRAHVVYVDSGSSDGSVELAARLGATTVELEPPFTAARGRNAGFAELERRVPDLEWVHFVDGDCEVCPGWLEAAVAFLRERDDLALVLGRRRERHPEASPWNRLIDMEWRSPPGEGHVYGGDMLVRASAQRTVGGYDPTLIAGEDPELTLRMLRAGLRGARLDREMTRHDAAMTRFSQWWQRAVRCGHAYAETAWLHRGGPERFRRRQVVSVLLWSGLLPLASVALVWGVGPVGLGPLALYGVLWLRIRAGRLSQGDSSRDANLYAGACLLAKFAELQGMGRFARNRLFQRRSALIEYK